MITANEKKTLELRGLIRLNGLLPAAKVTRARQAALERLERAGVQHEGESGPSALASFNLRDASAKRLNGLSSCKEIAGLIGEEARQVISELLDGRETFPQVDRAQVLFTPPNARSWTVPHQSWHLDLPRLPESGIPGVQVFTFLDTVLPGGGGTLVVAGSHRLLNENRRISSQQAKRILKREPYFRDLMSGESTNRLQLLHEPGRSGEVELQIVELHGEPGDVFFTDLRLLHAAAPNAARSPRIMLTQRFLLASLRELMFEDVGGAGASPP